MAATAVPRRRQRSGHGARLASAALGLACALGAGCAQQAASAGTGDLPDAGSACATLEPCATDQGCRVGTRCASEAGGEACEDLASVSDGTPCGSGLACRGGSCVPACVVSGTCPGDTQPTVTAFAPASGAPGSSVVVSGRNFVRVSSVTFGGAAAAFTIGSAFELAAVVPAGAVTGRIAITTASGTATSATDFVVTGPRDAFPEGMVSLTFDDGYSQLDTAWPALDAAGYKGTFYVITGDAQNGWGMSLGELSQLRDAGHEVGSHTVSHPRLTALSSSQLASELVESQTWLVERLGLPAVPSFAYPFGIYDLAVKAEVARHYASGRAFTGDNPLDSLAGPDVRRNLPGSDRYALGTYPAGAKYGSEATQLERIKRQVDDAIAERSWLVLVFHDVVERSPGDYGVTQGFLQDVLSYLRATGVKVVTVGEGVALMSPAR